MQPTKFKMGDKTAPTPKKEQKSFSISWSAILLFIIAVGMIAFSTFHGVRSYQSWRADWDVVMFARENPEFVREMKITYETEINALETRMMKGVGQAKDNEVATVSAATNSASSKTQGVK